MGWFSSLDVAPHMGLTRGRRGAPSVPARPSKIDASKVLPKCVGGARDQCCVLLTLGGTLASTTFSLEHQGSESI